MSFEGLPFVLKSLITDFAYECTWKIVKKDLDTCEEIKNLQVCSVFRRDRMWSTKYREFLPTPLVRFEPIRNFTDEWSDYFDWHTVQELLWRLDFRRKFVKLPWSRDQWREMFHKDWRNIAQFDAYYHFLLYTRVPCFKPLWKPLGFSCLQSFSSPFLSARWWLFDDF
jgi:hypothetical protein